MKQIKSIIITACILLPSLSYGMMQQFTHKPNSALGAMRQQMAKIYQMPRSQKLAAARAYVARPALQTKLKAAAMLSGAGLTMAYGLQHKEAHAEDVQKGYVPLFDYDPVTHERIQRRTAPFETQSEAHASLDVEFALAKYVLTPSKFVLPDEVEQRRVMRERLLKDTHYVFYHSQPIGMMIAQDVLRALYELKHNVVLREDFVFLRCPWDARLQGLTDVNTFLDKYHPIVNAGEQDALWAGRGCCNFDARDGRATQLLSANLALYGCMSKFDDCTAVYLNHKSDGETGPRFEELLRNIFTHYDLAGESSKGVGDNVPTIDELKTVCSLTDKAAATNCLLAIFIEKAKADKYVYAARGYGCPYNKKIAPDCYDASRKRHTAIAPILEKYKTMPASFANPSVLELMRYYYERGLDSIFRDMTKENAADRVQARILMAPEMLDPNSGVIFDEEPMMLREKRLELRAQVKAIIRQAWNEGKIKPESVQLLNKLMLMPS